MYSMYVPFVEIDQGTYSVVCKPGRLARSFLKRTSIWHDQSEEMRLPSIPDDYHYCLGRSKTAAGFTMLGGDLASPRGNFMPCYF